MSRRKKNLRAFLYQNPEGTVEQAWCAAWDGAQKYYHAKRIAELEQQVVTITAENKALKANLIISQQGDVCGEEFSGAWQGYDGDEGATVGLYYPDGSLAVLLRIPDMGVGGNHELQTDNI